MQNQILWSICRLNAKMELDLHLQKPPIYILESAVTSPSWVPLTLLMLLKGGTDPKWAEMEWNRRNSNRKGESQMAPTWNKKDGCLSLLKHIAPISSIGAHRHSRRKRGISDSDWNGWRRRRISKVFPRCSKHFLMSRSIEFVNWVAIKLRSYLGGRNPNYRWAKISKISCDST